jgi:anti-anti-sigma factor
VIKLWTCPDSTVICQPLGGLDLDAATQLRHLIAGILRPRLNLVFDLSQVDHIDAVGASALMGAVRQVRAMGGRSRMRHVNPRIRWRLEIIGVDRFLTHTVTSDEPEAA